MKKLSQMRKDELLAVAAEHDVEADESMTKAEIKTAIDDAGIDDETIQEPLSAPATEERESEPAETNVEVLVKMTVEVNSYSYGRYVFTAKKPFAIMPKEQAENLIRSKPDKFKKATAEELKRYYS